MSTFLGVIGAVLVCAASSRTLIGHEVDLWTLYAMLGAIYFQLAARD